MGGREDGRGWDAAAGSQFLIAVRETEVLSAQ